MSLRSKSSIIFSPRLKVITEFFGIKIDEVAAETAKDSKPSSPSQDQYTYVYTSDGIEVRQPQQKANRLPLVAASSSYGSPSSMNSRKSLGSDLSVSTIPSCWGVVKADESQVLPSISESQPLLQRRGRNLAKLNGALYAESDHSADTPLHADTNSPECIFPPVSQQYFLVKDVGVGGEGQCSLVMRKGDSQLRVIKSVKRPRKYAGKPIEAVILQDVLPDRHNNIIHLHNYEMFSQGPGVSYYFEYCAGGDLYDLVSRYNDHNVFVPELFIWKAFIQLASALESLHRGFHRAEKIRTGIVHRDIKPENIFLRLSANEKAYPDVVLADFGCATFEFATYERKGTYCWQGPEIPRQTPKGDVYSLGAIIHYLIHLESPLAAMPDSIPNTKHNRRIWDVTPEARQPKTTIPEPYSEELCEFMLVATNLDHNTRIDSSRLSKELNKFATKYLPSFAGPNDESHDWPLADWAFGSDGESCRASRRVLDESRAATPTDLGNQQYFQMFEDWEADKMRGVDLSTA